MVESKAIVYFKDGSSMPVKYMSMFNGYSYDFTLDIDGEERDFMYQGHPEVKDDRKWLELKLDSDGEYKKTSLKFDYIEIRKVLK